MKIRRSMIDPDLRLLGTVVRFFNRSFTEAKLRQANKLTSRQTLPRQKSVSTHDDTVRIHEEWILREDGTRLRVCVIKPPRHVENVPGVLWLHGGGYAIGSPNMAVPTAKLFFETSSCVVVAPDYRLSVQAPYPAALEDSYTTLLWMKNHAAELGIRDDQLFVGGDSAGGGLTAALTLYARDKGAVAVAFQMPLYPMLDDRMTSASASDNDAPVWDSKSNYNAWKLYLGALFEKPDVPAYAAAARADNYAGLPPTVTFVGALEPFRDETVQYVDALRKAGVPVEFRLFEGCFHGFDQLCPRAEVSQSAKQFLKRAYQFAVEHYFAEQKI